MRSSKAARSSGFTLIELLVVIAIIGVLVSLLLPAVQKVREAANRMKCQNNLKQLALAFHTYENAHGYVQSSLRTETNKRQGWVMFLLPYIEQGNLLNNLDRTQGWNNGVNRDWVGTRLSVVECASTPNQGRKDGAPDDPTPWQPEFAACSDYAAIYGIAPYAVTTLGLPSNASGDALKGILPRNVQARFAEVSDGLSNTIMIVESAGRPTLYQGTKPAGPITTHRVNGGGWARPGNDFEFKGSSSNGSVVPGNQCAVNCTNGANIGSLAFDPSGNPQIGYPSPWGTIGTGETYSFHADGANVAFGDGSVHFLSAAIPVLTFAKLVTRCGGEVVTDY